MDVSYTVSQAFGDLQQALIASSTKRRPTGVKAHFLTSPNISSTPLRATVTVLPENVRLES